MRYLRVAAAWLATCQQYWVASFARLDDLLLSLQTPPNTPTEPV